MKTVTEAGNYYLGLDIGTDSVGYAVTNPEYELLKFKGEPAWGVTLFDAAATSAERRQHRVERRRIDRRQQRVALLEELFAEEICKTDPDFFKRRKESALFYEDSGFKYSLFEDTDFTDKEYSRKYPTIHHLICDLMESDEPHDIRLVYHACAWLVAHRGHFLFDVSPENVGELLNFDNVYSAFVSYFVDELGCSLPWDSEVTGKTILDIMQMKAGVAKKQDAFKEKVYGGSKISKAIDDSFPFSRDAIVKLLCGGKVKPADIFGNDEYAEIPSIALDDDDEEFAEVLSALEDDAELLRRMRAVKDCALLIGTQNGRETVSEAMTDVYNQHRKDLKWLKYFVRKYIPDEYNAIFRDASSENYVAYSYNVKNADRYAVKKANSEKFLSFLKKKVDKVIPDSKDKAAYEDMLARIDLRSFLPKQKSTNNRVIPQQLYRYELERLLNKAEKYTPLLSHRDGDGFSVKDKVLSIFDFRVPYYVGPMNRTSSHAWLERKAEGRIHPWDYTEKVDLDKSEEAFIRRMTGKCTYLPGEDVLPVNSLLYCRYNVLNEINRLKINGNDISAGVKQEIFNDVFMKYPRVTLKKIGDYLISRTYMGKDDSLSGTDETIKSSLKSYHQFRNLLDSSKLSENQAEEIIERAAVSEDKRRLSNWIKERYPSLSAEDIKYICRLNLKEYGRLSRKFLTGIYHTDEATGEALSIMDMLWNTNCNLMQLLSDSYGFSKQIEEFRNEYYSEHPPAGLNERLEEMYISNSVKRPIIRTLAITEDVVKAFRGAPEKIFIEMARGGSENQKGKRTKTRKQQLLELYANAKEDTKLLIKELENMGEKADNMLQSDRLFLYYLQMGKCAYSGEPIDLTRLGDGTYNIDHIYPRAFVKDDSILNNLVLVKSTINGAKTNTFPVDADIQHKMRGYWLHLKENGLMTGEKYRRLTRTTHFTEEEKLAFINRQLVETRQSTKAVAEILKERYPNSEIVYVKAGLVSEFRQEFDCVKCRSVNDLHHAKDAYLNIAVGNVYNEKFSRRWFDVNREYSIKVGTIFSKPLKRSDRSVWRGEEDIAKIKKYLSKNTVHVTRYAYCRKCGQSGGLFNQQPEKAAPGLIPLKAGMDTARYGGYNNSTASYYLLARYSTGKKKDVMFVPVELMYADRVESDKEFAEKYIMDMVSRIINKNPESVEIMLNGRKIRINTMLELDGLRICIKGKTAGGSGIIISFVSPMIVSRDSEIYIKHIESYLEKSKKNPSIILDSEHDHITKEKNLSLFDELTEKLHARIYREATGNPGPLMKANRDAFIAGSIEEQVRFLMNTIQWLGASSSAYDFTLCKGSKRGGAKYPSSGLSGWRKKYKDIRVINSSASGLFETKSMNLLELL